MTSDSVTQVEAILAGLRQLSEWEQASPEGPGWRTWNRTVDRVNRLAEAAVSDPIALSALQEVAASEQDPAVRRRALAIVRPDVPRPDSMPDLQRWLNNPLVNLGDVALEPLVGVALVPHARSAFETDADPGDEDDLLDLRVARLTWLLGEPSGLGAQWPRRSDGLALVHLAQAELRDSPSLTEAWPHLPISGVLQFFHDLETIGDDEVDGQDGGWLVRYLPDPPEALTPHPEDLSAEFRPRCPVRVEVTWTFPSPLDLELSEEAFERLEVANERVRETASTSLGLFEGCDVLDLPIMVGYGDESTDEAVERLASVIPLQSDADRYILLLDVPGTGPFEGLIGDMGHLEFWIRESDLELRQFEKSWALLR